jgi:hypothetical protein
MGYGGTILIPRSPHGGDLTILEDNLEEFNVDPIEN